MYLGKKIKIDKFDGQYVEIGSEWLMDTVWKKYHMPLQEFLQSYDRRDSDYILSLALHDSIEFQTQYDEDYLLIR